MKNLIQLLVIAVCFTLASCEKLLIEPNPDNNPESNFDLLWKEVDEKFSYFSHKNIDWDSVYNIYRPRVYKGMHEDSLFNVMADMLFVLRDGHVNLQSPFNVSRNWEWYQEYPRNYDRNIIEREYLGKDFKIVGPFSVQVIDSVAYVRYGSFMGIFGEKDLDVLVERYNGYKGMIIDIRDNGGGVILMAEMLATRFAREKTLVNYTRYKDGPGREEFTTAFAKHLDPADKKLFSLPTVVLTNRSTYSAANYFAFVMAELPGITLVGDRTGGGGGAPISSELPIGWTFRFSTNQGLNPRMEHHEDGIEPHLRVDMLKQDSDQGMDTILEQALDLLR